MRVNVSDLLTDADLGATTFERWRPTSTRANEGEASCTYPDGGKVTLTGIVQPANTRDAQFLEEGVRIADVQVFFTTGDVSVGGNRQLPDLLKYGGETYRALHSQDFDKHGMRRVLAQRVAAGTPAAPEGDGG